VKNVGLGANGGGVVKQLAGLNGELENQGGESGDFGIDHRRLQLHLERIGLGWRILLKERQLAQHGGYACRKDESPEQCMPRAFP
jgi:hypothetical protein